MVMKEKPRFRIVWIYAQYQTGTIAVVGHSFDALNDAAWKIKYLWDTDLCELPELDS